MWLALGGFGAVAVLAFVVPRVRRPVGLAVSSMLLALSLGLVMGAASTAERPTPWTPPADFRETRGTVDETPRTAGSAAVVTIRPDDAQGFPAGARLQLTLPPLPDLNLGDRVLVVGDLIAVEPRAPWRAKLAAANIVAIAAFPEIVRLGEPAGAVPWATALHRTRETLTRALQACLPEPQAGLVSGLLVGANGSLTDDVRQALVASGVSHLVVVSGYNITLVAAALSTFARGHRLGALVPFAGIWLFTLIAGANPPALRAAVMGTVTLLTTTLGRGADPLGTLLIVAAGMLVLEPRLATDLGFQLSALATAGLITLQPRVAALLPWLPGSVREPVAGTIAAQLATLPILASTFHQISTVAPISNTLAAPAVPLTTIAAAVAAPLVAIVPSAAPLGTAILAVPSTYLLAVIETTAALPGASLALGDVPAIASAAYALALVAWAALPTPEGRDLWAWTNARPRLARSLAVIPLAMATGSLAAMSLGSPSSLLSLSIFEAGGGPALWMRTPAGQTLLIDGGTSPATMTSELGRRMRLSERTLSLTILTALDSSHLPGSIAAVERYPPALAVAPESGQPSVLGQRWTSAVDGRLIRVREPTTATIEPGLTIELLPTLPLSATDTSHPQPNLIVRLRFHEISVLYAPSANPSILRSLGSLVDGSGPDVLIVPRGGAPESLDARSLNSLAPRLAIIPVATGNRARPPAPEILGLLAQIPTIRTDLSGTIVIESDGRRLWIRSERQS
ncbi:MAG: ComEC/Rec2 family competence protein [Chloroflexi bacterium]|nr:ComEC/Rec2 family competence protein [Chloroflexota bacterium]